MIDEMYKRMTPIEYKRGVEIAIQRTKQDLNKRFDIEYAKLQEDYIQKLKWNMQCVIDTISVELLYELADQMNYWKLKGETEEEQYIKDSAKIRIQEIYSNTMQSIQKYSEMKHETIAQKEFQKKKKKIEKEFKIRF